MQFIEKNTKLECVGKFYV